MKDTLSQMALWGQAPLFSNPLHVGRPNIPASEPLVEDFKQVLASRWLTNYGSQAQAFEAAICAELQVPHAIVVCNATVGLMVLLRALALQGEVIVPSFTFPATVHALDWMGLRPVFCDVEPHTHNLDPADVARRITPRTSAILGVHLWGRGCQVDVLQHLADTHGLKLIFDAAHAFACSWQGQNLGNFGEAEVFSFHATKFINSLEGGVITTRSEALAAKLRRLVNFGFDALGQVEEAGINAKLNEVSAMFGRHSLRQLPEIVAANQQRYQRYQAHLNPIPGLGLHPLPENERQNYQYVVLDVDAKQLGLSRDQLWQLLKAENVLVRRYFSPGSHRTPPYQTQNCVLPVSETLSERLLVLPTGTALSLQELDSLCERIHLFVEAAEQIQSRWPESVPQL
ncbi:MAG: aminotransferase class I/II-fold pyridoxal phosphate-dependent enzyme [Candidatus Sericytochromatia bacterium]